MSFPQRSACCFRLAWISGEFCFLRRRVYFLRLLTTSFLLLRWHKEAPNSKKAFSFVSGYVENCTNLPISNLKHQLCSATIQRSTPDQTCQTFMMYLWSDEQNIFSLTDKTNLVEIQRQFWQRAITAAGTARSWCELKPDMKYTMKTSMKWPKIIALQRQKTDCTRRYSEPLS